MTPIYHITHVDNLRSIVKHGRLWSDAQRLAQKIGNVNIGHSHIKQRRLTRTVPVAAKGFLGDYVPFNFCNRSVMLCAHYYERVEGYTDGQPPIVHLVSSVESVTSTGRPWAFTDRHADLGYTRFFDNWDDRKEVDWDAMPLTYWSEKKEVRQAEFLVHDWFPWTCAEKIGVYNDAIAERAKQAMAKEKHQPPVVVETSWYY
jgi:hypothetical protein